MKAVHPKGSVVRRLLPVLLAALLAVAGAVALGVGIAQRTVWLPDDEVTATAGVPANAPVAITGPGVLELRDGPVEVTARAPDGGPVVLAVGREADVLAWVGPVAHARLTGLADEGSIAVETSGGEPAVPNPAGSDLWVAQDTGDGSATLTYDRPDGRWLLLAAWGHRPLAGEDGASAAPAEISMTWPREASTSWSTPLIAGGVVLLLAAVVLLVVARLRRREVAS